MTQPLDVSEVRKILGFNQTQLAEALGIHQGTISAWEAGKHQPTRAARRAMERLLEDHDKQGAAA